MNRVLFRFWENYSLWGVLWTWTGFLFLHAFRLTFGCFVCSRLSPAETTRKKLASLSDTLLLQVRERELLTFDIWPLLLHLFTTRWLDLYTNHFWTLKILKKKVKKDDNYANLSFARLSLYFKVFSLFCKFYMVWKLNFRVVFCRHLKVELENRG